MSQILNWETVEAILRGARLALLYGPPGTGKTTAAVNAAKTLGRAVFNVTLTDETPAAELRGHYLPRGDEWQWHNGPAAMAAISGSVLVLNEIDKASADALDFLHGLLDDPGVAAITLPNGDTIIPHEDFRIFATMNGEIQDLPAAIADRFAIAIEIDTPHPDAIAALPENIRDYAANAIGRDEDETRPVTLRRVMQYVNLCQTGIDPENAAAAVWADRSVEVLDAIRLAESR